MATKFFSSVAFPIFLTLPLNGQTPYSELLPRSNLLPASLADNELLKETLTVCVNATKNGDLPSGYARVFIEKEGRSFVGKLESSTYRNLLVENCVLSRVVDLRNTVAKDRSWIIAEIITRCSSKFESRYFQPENTLCAINVKISNERGSNYFGEQIERHWKESGRETNQAADAAAGFINLFFPAFNK